MNTEQVLAIYEMVRASLAGEKDFGEIVMRLSEIGVERYHADYTRRESTFYLVNGETLVTALPCGDYAIGQEFSASVVESAVRQSQRGEHTYQDFLCKTMAAGCVGYFVQIAGKHVQYIGRRGEIHTEWFPGAKRD